MTQATMTVAFATAAAAWVLTDQFGNGRMPRRMITRHERDRLATLRRRSPIFAVLGDRLPSVAWLIQFVPRSVHSVTALRLRQLGRSDSWTSQEWLSVVAVESMIAGCLVAVTWQFTRGGVLTSLILVPVIALAWAFLAWKRLRAKARKRVTEIRSVLPFAIDGMGLVIKSGEEVASALNMAAKSHRNTALGGELSSVVDDVFRGQTLSRALLDLKERLDIAELDEFVNAASRTIELGGEVGDILLDMAARMRERRSRQIESDAGKAQVKLYRPGMLLLMVCLVTVVAPFVAPAWDFIAGITE